ncbi:MAG: hypothetical protein MJD61_20390 [Proteobacteria bacterium]|nr:hypothetical protein [Pseudomonadota bacterium]
MYRAGWTANARRLAFRVRDLALFLAGEVIPDSEELSRLSEIRERSGLSYSVHVSAGPELTSRRWNERRRAQNQLKRMIRHTRVLDPRAYVVACPAHHADRSGPELVRWQDTTQSALERLLGTGVDPARLCLQCRAPYEIIVPMLESLGVSIAMVLASESSDYAMAKSLLAVVPDRIRVIQWHGVDPDERAHRSLRYVPSKHASWLLGTLIRSGYGGLLTLSVFHESEFDESMDLVTRAVAQLSGRVTDPTDQAVRPRPIR